MMKKKVKKIPKYYEGVTWADMNKNQRTGAVIDATGTAVTNAIGSIGKPVTAAGVISGGLSGAQAGAAIGGPVGAGIGFAGGALLSSIGNKASTDGMGNITYSSGITRLLGIGKSDEEIRRQANLEKNSILSRTQTQNLQLDYYNENPTGSINVLAAEGGIMRQPVDALVSKGELIYNPVTKKLSQVPGSKGKPNKKDDVYAKLYEGDVVISNSPTMLMANGKTPAQNLIGMVDKYATGGTVKAREAIIKKVVNWQEANKTKPQEYAKFDEGEDNVSAFNNPLIDLMSDDDLLLYTSAFNRGDKTTMNFLLRKYNNEQRDIQLDEITIKGKKPISKVSGRTIAKDPRSIDMIKIDADGNPYKSSKDSVPSWRKTPTQHQIDVFRFGKNYKDIQDNRLYSAQSDLDEVVVTAPRINKVSSKKSDKKSSSNNNTTTSRVTTSAAPQEEKLTPEQIAESLRIQDIGERHWLRGDLKGNAISEPTRSLASLAKITPEKIKSQGISNVAPLTGIKPLDKKTGTTETAGYTGSNWKDNLYRMAVLSQPLWDRAKAEPVNYESPVYKYMPTQIDVSSQLRDTDQSYALARYNFANLYPNTGAGMAAGLQAATDRAKQYANIRQYQTNAQNELIGKNVGIYNNWANEHARIMNDVYNKTAANRASARNINRKNRAAALSNYGQMLRDDKQNAVDRMKFAALKPAIQSTYEDASANDIYKWYKELFG